jgi:hypothetical protein
MLSLLIINQKAFLSLFFFHLFHLLFLAIKLYMLISNIIKDAFFPPHFTALLLFSFFFSVYVSFYLLHYTEYNTWMRDFYFYFTLLCTLFTYWKNKAKLDNTASGTAKKWQWPYAKQTNKHTHTLQFDLINWSICNPPPKRIFILGFLFFHFC